MNAIISGLNKAFDNRIRLGIMAVLSVNERLDFNSLKELLLITDGNLATHLKALEKSEFVAVQKRFVGRKPNTVYSITSTGKEAFQLHLNALERIIEPLST